LESSWPERYLGVFCELSGREVVTFGAGGSDGASSLVSDMADSLTAAQPPSPGEELRYLASRTKLSPTSRRILASLLENPHQLAWLTARELAERVGVSQPSVSRLAASLGFDGYGALRDHLRCLIVDEAQSPWGSRGATHAQAVVGEEARHVTEAARIGDILIGADGLAAAAVASKPLVVAGVRASAYLGAYFAYLASKVHPHVLSVADGGSKAFDALLGARAAGADVVVCVCMPRYPSEMIRLVQAAARFGYRIALVCDQAMPSIPGVEPAWTLAVPVGSALAFDAHPAVLVALGLLADAMCEADPLTAESRMEMLDEAAEASGTYWSGG